MVRGGGLRVSAAAGRVGLWVGLAGVTGRAVWVCPVLGLVLGIAVVVALLGVVLLALVAVFGSDQSTERVFRLLRWGADRPEPPAPATIPSSDCFEDWRSGHGEQGARFRPEPGSGGCRGRFSVDVESGADRTNPPLDSVCGFDGHTTRWRFGV